MESPILIKLDQSRDKHAKPANNKPLNTTKTWVQNFIKKDDFFEKQEDKTKYFVEVDKNFNSDHTHAGLIYYAHYCWANEFGMSITPDMFLNAILSEINHKIKTTPSNYKHLFSDSTDKINIKTVGKLFDYDQLNANVRHIIANKDFASIICDIEFESDLPNAKLARAMTFASMGTPYFNYLGTMCGIPCLEIKGSEADWTKLYQCIQNLSDFGPNDVQQSAKHKKHIKKSANIVANIIYYCFGTKMNSFEHMHTNKEEFFSDIFHYGKNTICGSGHDSKVVSGWLRFLYADSKEGHKLANYKTHTNFVCMQVENTNRMYCQAVSLAYSVLDPQANILRPGYGIVTYKINSRKVYCELAMIPLNSGGRNNYPLSVSELTNIVKTGVNTKSQNNTCDLCQEKNCQDAIVDEVNTCLCMKCVELIKDLESETRPLLPCEKQNRVTNDRVWFTPPGKLTNQCTICEECFYKLIKNTPGSEEYTMHPKARKCNCDIESIIPTQTTNTCQIS
jgi:hypothetical protein